MFVLLAIYSTLHAVEEVPLRVVSKKYGMSRGVLQRLQGDASTFCGMISAICYHLKWDYLHSLVSNYEDRLNFGVQPELVSVRLNSAPFLSF